MLLSHILILAFALNEFFIPVSPRLRTNGKPIFIEHFYSHSFITHALKIEYDVQDNTEIFYNVTAFRPFPGRLLMNFFVRKYADVKGEPSIDIYKKRNLDFCKTLEILRNMTSNAMKKAFWLQDTFVKSCPLSNGFYFVQSGTIPSSVIPVDMSMGRYVVLFELIQVVDDLVKLMNLRFVIVVDENVQNSGENSNENDKTNSKEDPDVNWNVGSNENGSENSNENPNMNSNENTDTTADEGSIERNENSNENANEGSETNLSKNSKENKNINSDENAEPTTDNGSDANVDENSNENRNEESDTNLSKNSNENPNTETNEGNQI